MTVKVFDVVACPPLFTGCKVELKRTKNSPDRSGKMLQALMRCKTGSLGENEMQIKFSRTATFVILNEDAAKFNCPLKIYLLPLPTLAGFS